MWGIFKSYNSVKDKIEIAKAKVKKQGIHQAYSASQNKAGTTEHGLRDRILKIVKQTSIPKPVAAFIFVLLFVVLPTAIHFSGDSLSDQNQDDVSALDDDEIKPKINFGRNTHARMNTSIVDVEEDVEELKIYVGRDPNRPRPPPRPTTLDWGEMLRKQRRRKQKKQAKKAKAQADAKAKADALAMPEVKAEAKAIANIKAKINAESIGGAEQAKPAQLGSEAEANVKAKDVDEAELAKPVQVGSKHETKDATDVNGVGGV